MTPRAAALALALLLAAPLAPARAAAPPAPAPPASAKPRAAEPPPAHGRARVAPRRLDDIRIQGEIPVPQVLFITARDQRRFMEFQHHRYQVTSLELGRSTPGLSSLVVPTPSPDKAKQEVPR